ncbi:divergent polysaccharide deacetylase family protein [Marinobacterium arenosum]|uniref:divergent polysaccharide deacetylase family protein n=1 Tax=Marinobacterium arenosum TaxID=2862496 RepID=UPI001C978E9F|nr:divergent polysaccharide deacetylase family protein [Marinobacterium arenosum]MBY4678915.1 divergent polysaccharide deacetylase family protein [Marinobacterium arenosum]
MRRLWLSLLLILSSAVWAAGEDRAETRQPALVLIIDDMGDNLAAGRAALKLPGPVSYAFLPHSPYGRELAHEALFRDKEVMLHAPMANERRLRLGPGALTPELPAAEFDQVLNRALDSIPGVVGLNNHMGSLLTQQYAPMKRVMKIAAARGLFFLDSVTSPNTVAWRAARDQGIPYLTRDVFLDHNADTGFIDRQFLLALEVARKRGHVVVIGHPYDSTISYLMAALPTLYEQGIQQVSASAFLLQQQAKGERPGPPQSVAGPLYLN